jgi:hypothetical protein
MPRVIRRLQAPPPPTPAQRAGDVAEDAAFGAGAGTLATGAMSALMVAAERIGLMGRHPPEAIAETILDGAGVDAGSEALENAVATALHFAFGAAAGARSRTGRRRLPLGRGAAVPAGAAWGLVVWAVSYTGWIPWLRILPPPDEDRLDRQLTMVAAHLVYGATLGAIVARRRR